MIHQKFTQWNIANKSVFLRADLNVPLQQGKIESDFRLTSILPTLDFLIEHHATVIIGTHIARPTHKDPEFSTQILIPWFEQRGYSVRFVENCTTFSKKTARPKEIIMLENLRFFPEEKNGDPFFARQLAHTADYYINDAFGAIHENDCSIALLPYEFPEDKRSIGFLVEKELNKLDQLKNNPPRPFIAILGGGKIEDKIPLISSLIGKVDALLICPALCFTFLKSLHKPIGKSLVADNMLETVRKIMLACQTANVTYMFPVDYLVAANSVEGPLSVVIADEFPDNAIGISIGPKTVELFCKAIHHAQTIFLNCAMGFAHRPETCQNTKQIIDAMAQSSALTIIAGGDSVDTALNTQHHDHIDHLSTGGGAALAYLSDTLLPGLAPFD